jgi:hypothetical protein
MKKPTQSTQANIKKTSTSKASRIHYPSTLDDLKSALLVVSLTINATLLIGWLMLQVTTQYDVQIATLLFIR